MKQDYFIQDAEKMDAEALLLLLESQAESVEDHTYIHYYTPEEHTQMLSTLPEKLFKIDEEEEEMKAEIKAMKNNLDALKKSERALRVSIRQGYEEKTAKTFKILDYAGGRAVFVDTRGIIVSSRPLSRDERQLQLPETKVKSINS